MRYFANKMPLNQRILLRLWGINGFAIKTIRWRDRICRRVIYMNGQQKDIKGGEGRGSKEEIAKMVVCSCWQRGQSSPVQLLSSFDWLDTIVLIRSLVRSLGWTEAGFLLLLFSQVLFLWIDIDTNCQLNAQEKGTGNRREEEGRKMQLLALYWFVFSSDQLRSACCILAVTSRRSTNKGRDREPSLD